MKRNTIILIRCSLLVLLLSSSCSKAPEEFPAPSPEGCLVTVTCTPEAQASVPLRGLTAEEESRIADINLFAFHPATGTTEHRFLQGSNTASFRLFRGSGSFMPWPMPVTI